MSARTWNHVLPDASKTYLSPERLILKYSISGYDGTTVVSKEEAAEKSFLFYAKTGKTALKMQLDECVRLQRWHSTRHSPRSYNVRNCKFTAQRIKPHSGSCVALPRQVQALGFILSEVKWKKFTYSCCSTLKSITLWVKFAAFASGEHWGGSIHAWLLSSSIKSELNPLAPELRDNALWNDFQDKC